MSTVASPPLSRARRRQDVAAPTTRSFLREQTLVAAGQLTAGVGNLVFALLAARILAPGAFAQLTVFLALFLVVHVPLSALSAGSAVTPTFAARHRRRAAGLGLGAGLGLALLAVPLAGPLDVPAALLLVLAAGVPAAGWLALERGRLLGAGQHRRAVASLVAEPALRLGLGLPLAAATGAVGGAAGVVAGGWLALLVTRPGLPRRVAAPAAATTAGTAAGLAALGFLLLALVQNVDVVLANATLGELDAGRFAVLSTIGGVAAFATTTIPLVLLPRVRESPQALRTAVGLAALLGAAAVGATALVPDAWVGRAFGPQYTQVAGLITPYVGAMALLGIGRVLVAERIAGGHGRAVAAVLGTAAALQVTLVLLLGEDPRAIALITLATMVLVVLATAGTRLLPAVATPPHDRRPVPPPASRGREVPADPEPVRPGPGSPRAPHEDAAREAVPWLALAGLSVVALGIRLVVTRGVWLDEAISITQAQMPWGELMESLRTNDVHPPLHHAVLWVLAQTVGTAELVMRAPSILAGVLLVPALYALGHLLWDRRAGLLAAALATVAPFLVWYAQEARMYAFFMLFATLALLGQAWAMKGGGVKAWALYVLSAALLLWTQYFAVAFLAAQQLAFLAFIAARARDDRSDGLRIAGAWLGASAAIIVAVLPLVPLAVDQFQANEAAGRGFDQGPSRAGDVTAEQPRPGVYVVLTNLVWASLGYHSDAVLARLTALWPFAILAALFLLGRRPTWRIHLVAACAFVPVIIMFAAGMAKPFLFEIRYFVALAPLLLLLVARMATAWITSRGALAALSAGLIALLAAATVDELVNGANPRRYDFKGALAQVEEQMRPGDVLVYEPSYLNNVVGYYQPGLRSAPLSAGLPERRWAPRVFLLESFTDLPLHARNAGAARARLSRDRDVVGTFSRPQVKVTVYR